MKKIIAKVHLWLSIPFGIVISILCFTGALLVFETEIQEALNPSMYYVSEVKDKPIPLEELIPAVQKQLPDSVKISGVTIPGKAGRNYRMTLEGQGRTSLMVDPYTADIQGKISPYAKGSFFSTVRRLHRWFMFEYKRNEFSWGKMITGTATLLFFFIIVTGIIVWVPKTLKMLRRRLKIKFNKGIFRFWYDLHLAGGMYAALFLILFCLTGLTWSFGWYRTGVYKLFGAETVQTGGHGTAQQPTNEQASFDEAGEGDNRRGGRPEGVEGRGDRSGKPDNENTVETAYRGRGNYKADNVERQQAAEGERRGNRDNRAESGKRGETGNESTTEQGYRGRGGRNNAGEQQLAEGERRGGRGGGRPEGAEGRSGRGGGRPGGSGERIDYRVWTRVADHLRQEYPSANSISLQNSSASVSLGSTGNVRAADRYTFDTRSGDITEVQLYKDSNRAGKLRGWLYSVHVGSWGGIVTRILSCIACLIGTALPLTGYYFYFKKLKRRRKKKITATS